MYDELVKLLRDAAKMSEALAVLLPHSEGNATAKLYKEAADAIEDLSGFVQEAERDKDEFKERLYKTDDMMQKQWIPVTRQKPDYPGRFICYYEIDDCGEVGHCIDWGRYDEDDGWYTSGVTHWMPLPEPPKEET